MLFIKTSTGTTTVLFFFISLLQTLKQGLKSSAKPMYSSLHLTQVIKYMTYLPLQERSPFIKLILRVTLNENLISCTE